MKNIEKKEEAYPPHRGEKPLSEEFLKRCDEHARTIDFELSPFVCEARAMERITGADLQIRINARG